MVKSNAGLRVILLVCMGWSAWRADSTTRIGRVRGCDEGNGDSYHQGR